MEVEEIPRSKRPLREPIVEEHELAGDHHTNPAFSGDESLLMELISETEFENSRGKGNVGSAPTRKGYNMLGDGRGNPLNEHVAVHQAKEKEQHNSLNAATMTQASQNSLADPKVGFKFGHNSKTQNGVLADAENTYEVTITEIKFDHSQTQQPTTDRQMVSEGRSMPSAQTEGNVDNVGATSPAQRRWKSAMANQNKSLSGAVEKLHPGIAARWQSMRVARHAPAQPRRLLTQLSFSDSDATCILDYGPLEGGEGIPRKPLKSVPGQNEEVKLPPAAIKCFAGLMEQLLKRGKIREVALLNQSGGAPVTLRPMSWTIPAIVATGLAKSIKETNQPLVRLMINGDVYVCLNHGSDRLVGHSNDNDVLVAQKTNQYIVLGLSDEDTPGSCLQEVLELAEILSDKGW